MFLFLSHKRGVSSCQLARDLGVTQKTAWGMLHKIREYMDCENDHQLCEEVEIDETFVGGKNKNMHKDKKVEKCQGCSFSFFVVEEFIKTNFCRKFFFTKQIEPKDEIIH